MNFWTISVNFPNDDVETHAIHHPPAVHHLIHGVNKASNKFLFDMLFDNKSIESTTHSSIVSTLENGDEHMEEQDIEESEKTIRRHLEKLFISVRQIGNLTAK